MLLTTEPSVQPQDMIIRKLHIHKLISGSGFIVLERVSLWSSGWLQTFSTVQASPKLSALLSCLPRAQNKGLRSLDKLSCNGIGAKFNFEICSQ